MNTLLRDIQYGLRTLARSPGFTAVAVLTIGIGIGASTTIFSWMRSLMLNPLPGATQTERIVALENTAADGEPLTSSYLDFRDYRDNLRLVTSVTARTGNVFSVGDAPQDLASLGRTGIGQLFRFAWGAARGGAFLFRSGTRRRAERARSGGHQSQLLESSLPHRSFDDRIERAHQPNAFHHYWGDP